MPNKMKNVETPSISSELRTTREEMLAGLQKIYDLNLDIIEIYKIVSSLDYMITEMNKVDRFSLPEIAIKRVDHQTQKVKDLIGKIDKQVGYEAANHLKYEGSFPK